MKVRAKLCAGAFAVAGVLFAFATVPVLNAQQRDHAVSVQELRRDVQKVADTRQSNETAVRELLSTDAARKAMNSAGVDYKKVDDAIGQLNDQDLARLALRSREAQKDFAAGTLSDRDLLIIILAVAALVLIIVAVR